MNNFPYLPDFIENESLPKVNQLELMENILNCTTEEKIRLLKFVFSDLDLLTIKEASDKLCITTNGVRSTRNLIELGGKKYVKL